MYKNIFISQPMTGLSEEEILATRQKEVDEIYQFANKDNVQVNIIDSYIDDKTRGSFQEYITDVINWDIYWLSQSLQKLALADVLWLCDGWERSKGCNIELECAIQYGLDIAYQPMRKNERILNNGK